MGHPKVPAEVPTGYAATAAELRRVADAIEHLPGSPAFVSVDIQPGPREGGREEIISAVDAVSVAVCGKTGQTEKLGHGGWSHRAADERTFGEGEALSWFQASVYQRVPGPPDPRDAELAELRAQNAKLTAELWQAGATRIDTDAEYAPEGRTTAALPPKPDMLGVALGHHGGDVTGAPI